MADADDDIRGSFYCWSWEENKEFEMALSVIDEDDPERWKKIASMIGGKKSAGEVRKHYEALIEDLDIIETGRLDQEFGEGMLCAQHGSWTDDDQKFLCYAKNESNC